MEQADNVEASKETEQARTRIKKDLFIDAFAKSFGNVSQSCRAADIARSRYYVWRNEDEEFAQSVDDVNPREHMKDFIESKLVEKINSGDTACIIFAAKTLCKDRGYIEKQEIENSGTVVNITEVRTPNP